MSARIARGQVDLTSLTAVKEALSRYSHTMHALHISLCAPHYDTDGIARPSPLPCSAGLVKTQTRPAGEEVIV